MKIKVYKKKSTKRGYKDKEIAEKTSKLKQFFKTKIACEFIMKKKNIRINWQRKPVRNSHRQLVRYGLVKLS